MTTQVSKSFDLAYGVRQVVETGSLAGGSFYLSFSSAFDVASAGDGLDVEYDVKERVSSTYSIDYGVRKSVSPSKVFSLRHAVRSVTSRAVSIAYGVRVPISSPKTVGIEYDVRSRVSSSVVVQYDVLATTSSTVSKSFSIKYHTLIKPTVGEIITVSVERDSVPPQVITTTSY